MTRDLMTPTPLGLSIARRHLSTTVFPFVPVEGLSAGGQLFSPKTVARAVEFYEKVKRLPSRPGAREGWFESLGRDLEGSPLNPGGPSS